MKLFVLAMLAMVAIAIWLLRIADGRMLIIPKVKEEYLVEYRYKVQGTLNDELATYAYTSCIDKLWTGDWKYSCKNRAKTINAENKSWHTGTVSKTKDYWIVQLHYTRHKNFINSKDFNDPRKQLDYGLGVWIDAKKKWVMPWYAYYQMDKRSKSVVFKTMGKIWSS